MYDGIIKRNNTAWIVRSFYILGPILYWNNLWIILYAFGLFKILMNIGWNVYHHRHHDIAEILLKAALNTMKLSLTITVETSFLSIIHQIHLWFNRNYYLELLNKILCLAVAIYILLLVESVWKSCTSNTNSNHKTQIE